MTDGCESGDVTFVEFPTQSPLRLGPATIATFGPSPGCGRTRGSRLAKNATVATMLGESPEMKEVTEHLRRIAPSMAAVMLVGESGTGKEVAAELLHAHSARADKPFVSVNCGAIPANLVEAELFGYERGAFTGAVRQHQGYFERARGGTLFLDEITEMPIDLQAKLLRVLETGRMVRVGGSEEIPLDVRIVTATNRPSEAAVRDHVTFGRGPHNCPGAGLGRLQIRLALEEVLARTKGFEIVGDIEMTRWPEYGPLTVPLRFW